MAEKHKFLVRPLFLQVRDELALKISSNQWKVGECIPNEGSLAADFGVSQGTMRKALDLLEAERLVVRRQGRGTFVVDANTSEIATRFSSFFNPMGEKIEGAVTILESETVAADETAIKYLSAQVSDMIHRTTRQHTYDGKPFMIETSYILVRHWAGADHSDFAYSRITELAQKCGIILSHAVENAEACACPNDIAEKLATLEGSPVLCVKRSVYSDRGDCVEHRSGWSHLVGLSFNAITS